MAAGIYSLILSGNLVFTIGMYWKQVSIIMIGRVIFGLGLNPTNLLAIHLSIIFFKKENLTFAQVMEGIKESDILNNARNTFLL